MNKHQIRTHLEKILPKSSKRDDVEFIVTNMEREATAIADVSNSVRLGRDFGGGSGEVPGDGHRRPLT